MPSPGKGLTPAQFQSAHLLVLFISGPWIPGCSPWLWYWLLLSWAWQLITFPSQLVGPQLSLVIPPLHLPLTLCPPTALDKECSSGLGSAEPCCWARDGHGIEMTLRQGVENSDPAFGHSLPREIGAPKRLSRHFPLSSSSETWTQMSNCRRVCLHT